VEKLLFKPILIARYPLVKKLLTKNASSVSKWIKRNFFHLEIRGIRLDYIPFEVGQGEELRLSLAHAYFFHAKQGPSHTFPCLRRNEVYNCTVSYEFSTFHALVRFTSHSPAYRTKEDLRMFFLSEIRVRMYFFGTMYI